MAKELSSVIAYYRGISYKILIPADYRKFYGYVKAKDLYHDFITMTWREVTPQMIGKHTDYVSPILREIKGVSVQLSKPLRSAFGTLHKAHTQTTVPTPSESLRNGPDNTRNCVAQGQNKVLVIQPFHAHGPPLGFVIPDTYEQIRSGTILDGDLIWKSPRRKGQGTGRFVKQTYLDSWKKINPDDFVIRKKTSPKKRTTFTHKDKKLTISIPDNHYRVLLGNIRYDDILYLPNINNPGPYTVGLKSEFLDQKINKDYVVLRIPCKCC